MTCQLELRGFQPRSCLVLTQNDSINIFNTNSCFENLHCSINILNTNHCFAKSSQFSNALQVSQKSYRFHMPRADAHLQPISSKHPWQCQEFNHFGQYAVGAKAVPLIAAGEATAGERRCTTSQSSPTSLRVLPPILLHWQDVAQGPSQQQQQRGLRWGPMARPVSTQVGGSVTGRDADSFFPFIRLRCRQSR